MDGSPDHLPRAVKSHSIPWPASGLFRCYIEVDRRQAVVTKRRLSIAISLVGGRAITLYAMEVPVDSPSVVLPATVRSSRRGTTGLRSLCAQRPVAQVVHAPARTGECRQAGRRAPRRSHRA